MRRQNVRFWSEHCLRQTYVPKAPNSSPICNSLLLLFVKLCKSFAKIDGKCAKKCLKKVAFLAHLRFSGEFGADARLSVCIHASTPLRGDGWLKLFLEAKHARPFRRTNSKAKLCIKGAHIFGCHESNERSWACLLFQIG